MMDEQPLFPTYIRRDEEQRCLARMVDQVRTDHRSRAVLISGPGGVGKTSLIRAMAEEHGKERSTVWLEPVDVDDPEYWLLSNLERKIASEVDPATEHFGPYLDYVSRLPAYTRPRASHQTVIAQLGRIKRVFIDCYRNYVEDGDRTVVITLDTVEAIRGTYPMVTLTQWMKALPRTLFILSGRPIHSLERPDPIKEELEDPYQGIPVITMLLGEFDQGSAVAYLDNSGVASGLTDETRAALVRLTRGYPLWLAFAVSYLKDWGIPQEARLPWSQVDELIPYSGELSPSGEMLHEAFKRRILTPYRNTDFWHEAVKRLAVVRHGVSELTFRKLMEDRPLPEDVRDIGQAWKALLGRPWIRIRANGRYVTLHDAVAEELALRIISQHDQDGQWRRELWQRAEAIYDDLTEGPSNELAERLAVLDTRLQDLDARRHLQDQQRPSAQEEDQFIRDVAATDRRKSELDQLRAVRLHYKLLHDPDGGCRQFLDVFARAGRENEVLLQERLAAEMQRFLPGSEIPYALGDVVGKAIGDFHSWLADSRQDLYIEIGLDIADYLIEYEQPKGAVSLLGDLPRQLLTRDHRYRFSNLLGNACMRMPGRVKEGLQYFDEALREATREFADVGTVDRQRRIADAYKELGFYYRNAGLWKQAGEAYRKARDAILVNLEEFETDEDSEELASIQTNWAYIKGLAGSYREGSNLAESAIAIRQRLDKPAGEGLSWSVRGEVYRYERRFHAAWESYAAAESIFQGERMWSSLGLVYQQQAICLFQAAQDRIHLIEQRDAIAAAEQRITIALNLCRDHEIRGYPSALNRAGRIFGSKDVEAGLAYLVDGIDWARKLSDGWFWFANMVEYAELSYRGWRDTGNSQYLSQVGRMGSGIMAAVNEYDFPDLLGRWKLLQGHLGIHEWKVRKSEDLLAAAFGNYADGFCLIAGEYVGSSGAAALPDEFKRFGALFRELPEDVRAVWRRNLRRIWSNSDSGSDLLLARLEELY